MMRAQIWKLKDKTIFTNVGFQYMNRYLQFVKQAVC